MFSSTAEFDLGSQESVHSPLQRSWTGVLPLMSFVVTDKGHLSMQSWTNFEDAPKAQATWRGYLPWLSTWARIVGKRSASFINTWSGTPSSIASCRTQPGENSFGIPINTEGREEGSLSSRALESVSQARHLVSVSWSSRVSQSYSELEMRTLVENVDGSLFPEALILCFSVLPWQLAFCGRDLIKIFRGWKGILRMNCWGECCLINQPNELWGKKIEYWSNKFDLLGRCAAVHMMKVTPRERFSVPSLCVIGTSRLALSWAILGLPRVHCGKILRVLGLVLTKINEKELLVSWLSSWVMWRRVGVSILLGVSATVEMYSGTGKGYPLCSFCSPGILPVSNLHYYPKTFYCVEALWLHLSQDFASCGSPLEEMTCWPVLTHHRESLKHKRTCSMPALISIVQASTHIPIHL